MYAIVQTGGKQYKADKNTIFKTEMLDAEVGSVIELPVMLYSDGDTVLFGKDAEKVTVKAEVLEHGKGEKIIVYKYKAKKNSRKKQGHRQPYTKLKVTDIVVGG
jgi:large subunit ribosomal protein L21